MHWANWPNSWKWPVLLLPHQPRLLELIQMTLPRNVILLPRGDEQGQWGTYWCNQVIPIDAHWHGNRFWILRWPFVKMRLRPQRLLGRQRPIVEQPSDRQKPTILLDIRDRVLLCRHSPVPSNNHMQRVCNVWKQKPWKRRGENCLSFPTCLWSGIAGLPPGSPWGTNGPLHLLMGNMLLASLLNIPPQVSSTTEESTLVIPHATTPVAPGPCTSGQTTPPCSPDQVVSSPQSGDEVVGTFKEPPHLRWKNDTPFMKSLKGIWWQAFAKDSDLVQQAEGRLLQDKPPLFCKCKTLHMIHQVSSRTWLHMPTF